MIISTIKNLVDYFNDFADEHEIAFVYGPAKKLIDKSKSSSEFSYPIVHLNRPVIKSSDNGMSNYMKSFKCEVTCLQKFSKKGEPSEIDAAELDAENETLEILMMLEKKMVEDNEENLFVFDLNTSVTEPVSSTMFIDSHTGWRMDFDISFYANAKIQ